MRIGRPKIRVANPTPATYSLWGRRSSISALGVLSRGNHFWKVINGALFLHPFGIQNTSLFTYLFCCVSLVDARQDPIIAVGAVRFHEVKLHTVVSVLCTLRESSHLHKLSLHSSVLYGCNEGFLHTILQIEEFIFTTVGHLHFWALSGTFE